MLPSKFLEVQEYLSLQRLLQEQVDMQFTDLRTLFLLPQEGMEGGCNFAAASVLFNIIAGASVCFYDPSMRSLNDRGDRSKRFKDVLVNFYPWGEDEPISKEEFATVLYKLARNPLIHSFGLDQTFKNKRNGQIYLGKQPLTKEQITELEEASIRPPWTQSTITLFPNGSGDLLVGTPTLYWGVHRMLHNLFASEHIKKADELAQTFSNLWVKYVSETGTPPGRTTRTS